MTYEQEYQKLRRIAELLEEGDLPLDHLVGLLREATVAFEGCKVQLQAARAALEDLERVGTDLDSED